MSNVREMRIFSAEQIVVPDEFPGIIKNYTKEVIRNNPENVVTFSRLYFEELLKERGYFDAPNREKVDVRTKEFYLSHKD